MFALADGCPLPYIDTFWGKPVYMLNLLLLGKKMHLKMSSAACKCLCQGLISNY